MEITLNAAGGLAIFLLAMAMMTDGLKSFGGEELRRLLAHWTSSPIRAVLTGAMVTGVVQSSSAVTVATIGFVNAGILTLRQSLGVVFGANVGTTMTGWLVSLVGFGFKIEALALPIIAVGMGLRVAVPRKRLRGLGEALVGFGLFFLGLSVLKDAFSGLTTTFGTATLSDGGAGGVALFAVIGLVATILTQSSSAAMALILTAAAESTIGIGAAAAAVIGANVGTTSTAVLAVIRATPSARRVAVGHIAFNLSTAVVAFLILPLLLWSAGAIGRVFGLADHPAVILALFHTVFNVLGVILLLPFIGRISARLERLFVTPEEDISRPQFLDNTVAATPAFAVFALRNELARMHGLVCASGLTAIEGRESKSTAVERRSEAILHLGRVVRSFAVTVRMEGMSQDLAEALPRHLRIGRYLEEAALLLSELHATGVEEARLLEGPAKTDIQRLLNSARGCFELSKESGSEVGRREALQAAKDSFESTYQETKATLLRAAATHSLSIEKVDRLLDTISGTRRMVDQLTKATFMLRNEKREFQSDSTTNQEDISTQQLSVGGNVDRG